MPTERHQVWSGQVTVWFLVILALATVSMIVVWGVQGWTAYKDLVAVRADLGVLTTRITDHDADEIDALVQDIQQRSESARRNTSGPHWAVASRFPYIGDDVTAVRQVALSVEYFVAEAVPGLQRLANSFDPTAMRTASGRVNIELFQQAAPDLRAASMAAKNVRTDLTNLDLRNVHPTISGPTQTLTARIVKIDDDLSPLASIAELAPRILGIDGPKRYLLLVQNNAEVRASGGIPGATVVLSVDDGQITVDQQIFAGQIDSFDEPVVELGHDGVVHGENLGKFFANINLTPDFPMTAQLGIAMWDARFDDGRSFDGVWSVDPVLLSYLLKASGPVPSPDGSVLTGENVVSQVLNKIYLEEPNAAKQNRYFQLVTLAVFQKLLTIEISADFVKAFKKGVDESRFLMWSADPQIQTELEKYPISGSMRSDAASRTVGVFLNNSSIDKKSYYLRQEVSLSPICHSQDLATHTLTVELQNALPPGSVLPQSVTGPRTKDNILRTFFLVYPPRGGTIVSANIEGKSLSLSSHEQYGRLMGIGEVEIPPASKKTMTITFISHNDHDMSIRTTPLSFPTPVILTTGC